MASPTKETTKHLPELDGIRGSAILGVMCSHGVGLSGLFRRTPNSLLENFFAYFTIPLWGGVDLFFVLSGFSSLVSFCGRKLMRDTSSRSMPGVRCEFSPSIISR